MGVKEWQFIALIVLTRVNTKRLSTHLQHKKNKNNNNKLNSLIKKALNRFEIFTRFQ